MKAFLALTILTALAATAPVDAQTADSASYICREAKTSEPATAQTLGQSRVLLVCRNVENTADSELKTIGTVTVKAPNVMMFPYYATKQQLQDPALWQAFWARLAFTAGN